VSGICGTGTGNGVSWVLGRKSLDIEVKEAETFRVV
jgi:hypothetical protein